MTSSALHIRAEVYELVDEGPFSRIGGEPADEGSYDFFVSYVPADEQWAKWVAWQLEERLLLDDRKPRIFVAAWDIVAGANETDSRHRALIASKRLVAILTREYLEFTGAAEWQPVWSRDPRGHQRLVVPVRVKECQPDGFLRTTHYIDLVGCDVVSATNTLLAEINASVEGRAKPPTEPVFPGRGGRTEDTPPEPLFPGPPVVLVGEPPTVPANWFQDRSLEVEDIERRLAGDRARLVMVVGREGYGKTATIHRLWERVRTGKSPLHVHGLVYLSAHGFRPVTADSILSVLADLLPKLETDQLKLPTAAPPVEKLAGLLDALADRKAVIAIDAIEELLNENDDITETALRELVDYLVTRVDHGVRLLLVGRRTARAVADRFPDTKPPRNLNEGLPAEDAFALLQAMTTGGGLNLPNVDPHDKARLRELTDGSPRALELAYGVLATKSISFTQLLAYMARPDSESTVVRLLAHTYERLSLRQRRVLQALAVYGRPVPPAAVEHLVRDVVPDVDSHAVLEQLRKLRLAQSDGESFSVPATEERDHLINRLRNDTDAWETPETLMHRAADYFVSQRNLDPRRIEGLRPHLMEIELRLRAGDHRTAFELMGDVDDRYLRRWGTSSALENSLWTLLRGKGVPENLEIDAKSMLARALMQQEDHQTAKKYLLEAFELASGRGRTGRRIVLREQLAEACLQQGELRLAALYSRRACLAAIRRGRSGDATTALVGWAMCRAMQGKFERSLSLFATARRLLARFDTAAYRLHRPVILLGEAWIHGQIGERDRARSLLEEGRRHALALGDRLAVGRCQLGEAQLALDDGRPELAVTFAEKASASGFRDGNRWLCRVAMETLALARLVQDDVAAAARASDIAQRNHGSVLGFGLVGLAAYRDDRKDDARAAFDKGYRKARNRNHANERDFQFLDAKGLVACGLALFHEPGCLKTAEVAYQEARDITTDVGTGAAARAVLLLEQFGPDADPRILEQVRAKAEGEGRSALEDG